MIYELFSSAFGTLMEMFKNGGVITYVIAIIGIYGFASSMENSSPEKNVPGGSSTDNG